MKEKKIGLSHNFIIHSGETVKEFLEERNMLQKELAMRCDVSEKYISTIICGEKNISDDFAERLEYAFGIDANFWINLQSNYDKELLELEKI